MSDLDKKMRNLKKYLESLDEKDPQIRKKVFKWTREILTPISPRGYKELCVMAILHIGEATTTELIEALPFSPITTQQAIANLAGEKQLDSSQREMSKKPQATTVGMVGFRREHRKKYWYLTQKGKLYYQRKGIVLQNLLQNKENLDTLNRMFKGDKVSLNKSARKRVAVELLKDEDSPEGFKDHIRSKSKLRLPKKPVPRKA